MKTKLWLFCVLLFMSSFCMGESCSSVNNLQFKPLGSCATQSRKCCSVGTWSEWVSDENYNCPVAECKEGSSIALCDYGHTGLDGCECTNYRRCVNGRFVDTISSYAFCQMSSVIADKNVCIHAFNGYNSEYDIVNYCHGKCVNESIKHAIDNLDSSGRYYDGLRVPCSGETGLQAYSWDGKTCLAAKTIRVVNASTCYNACNNNTYWSPC